MKPPEYFDVIQKEASEDWESFKQRPHRAGPWYQLFKQVQSPRHVISELLQNADDANATEASVEIKNGELVFTHNGDDFNADQFQSLCRFGFSNKRALHTIGFRGIGFKSTFSIGDEVRLVTPTLSVAFRRERFTEPIWMDDITAGERTEIHVSIKDDLVKNELTKNFNEWKNSPASLLFFKSIRCLYIDNQEIRWVPQEFGPAENSQWMELANHPGQRFLHIVSEEEEFPEECLEEIKIERLAFEQELEFPPCRVEIVAGMEGKLFVVLPTGVKTNLPFASNAPFIQDSARLKIKELSISPTNRWLLERIGRLVSKSMLSWLKCENITLEERTEAYTLGPSVSQTDTSLEGSCGQMVEKAFVQALKNEALLLTESGELELANKCVAVPRVLLNIWEEKQVSEFFDEKKRIILSTQISNENLQKLLKWGFIQKLEKSQIIQVLETKSLPKPETWRQLMVLWEYLSDDITNTYDMYYRLVNHKGVRIVPVQGQDILFAGSDVKRLGEKQLLESEEDWRFLAQYLLVLNPNWTRYLAEQRLSANTKQDPALIKQVESAFKALIALNLGEASDVSSIIQQVSDKFFLQSKIFLSDCVKLAHIAATLGAQVSENFKFVTHNNHIHAVKDNVLAGSSDNLDIYIEQNYYQEHVLHPDYFKHSGSCSDIEWKQWVQSERSKLSAFAPLIQTSEIKWYLGKDKVRSILKERGFMGEPDFGFKSDDFWIQDWDFESVHWKYWKICSEKDTNFWSHLFKQILCQPPGYWQKAMSARISQRGRGGSTRAITLNPLLPAWILKFRELPCLQDVYGTPHQPSELLMRTPETEALLGVESFVQPELDNDTTKPLLRMLGVRDTPTGPEKLLERLTVLSKVPNIPLLEVSKWYQRLDQLIDKCTTPERQTIIDTFKSSPLIYCEGGVWGRSDEVFQASDETDVPGASIVHSLVRHLSLWEKIGVHRRPTVELTINWLKTLPSGKTLTADESRRVRTLLPLYPERIWNECNHWIDLEGRWTPVTEIKYALTMQSMVTFSYLFPGIKQKTANFQTLNEQQCSVPPFSNIPLLKKCIEERLQNSLVPLPSPQDKDWLGTLGYGLSRIILGDKEKENSIRQLGNRLAKTKWQDTPLLQTIPYIDGTPVGIARNISVLWEGTILYVARQSAAKMAKVVPQELSSIFGMNDISDTMLVCYERSSSFVKEYLEENFRLAPVEEATNVTEAEVADGIITTTNQSPEEKTIEAGEPTASDIGTEEKEFEHEVPVGECEPEPTGEYEDKPKPMVKPVKPPKPSLIELFAKARSFFKDGSERYCHRDGRWLEPARGNGFNWEMHDKSGDLIQYYWLKDHCLEHEPLQIDVVIWESCKNSPQLYSIVLVNDEGEPEEITGTKLTKLEGEKTLELYPASYRIVYKK